MTRKEKLPQFQRVTSNDDGVLDTGLRRYDKGSRDCHAVSICHYGCNGKKCVLLSYFFR